MSSCTAIIQSSNILQPIATILAAITVAVVTWVFSSRQVAITKRQADLAHDRLRFDLFDKRYEIYNAAKEAIEVALAKSNEDTEPPELRELFIKFNEAHFFFPKDIYVFLNQLRNDIYTFLRKNYVHRKNKAANAETQDAQQRKLILEEDNKMLELQEHLYTNMVGLPVTFARVLSFPQLTGNRNI